jgi:hypothetical protein
MPQPSSASSSACCANEHDAGRWSLCSTTPAIITPYCWPHFCEHAPHLKLLFLPPYSPQLASIERVWKLTRRVVIRNRYFATVDEVLRAVNAAALKTLCLVP